jgi:methylated-DNA-protein-cysteine methyltransferase-like protein
MAFSKEHPDFFLSGACAGDALAYEVLSAAAEIPRGKVATYGQLARLVGRERNSRLVGRILSHAELYGDYPCHRVVSAAGRLAPSWPEQAELLRAEGVELKANGCVDLGRYGWKC